MQQVREKFRSEYRQQLKGIHSFAISYELITDMEKQRRKKKKRSPFSPQATGNIQFPIYTHTHSHTTYAWKNKHQTCMNEH